MKKSKTKRSDSTDHGIPNKIITHRSSKGVIYVGIDVHKKFLQVAAVDGDGVLLLLNERTDADHASVRRFFSQFPRNGTRCVMESSSVWYGLYRYMTDTLGLEVILSNPYQTKAIAASKKKTDRVDARILTCRPVPGRLHSAVPCPRCRHGGVKAACKVQARHGGVKDTLQEPHSRKYCCKTARRYRARRLPRDISTHSGGWGTTG